MSNSKREQLLSQPETKEIAALLEIEPEAYVDQILAHAADPSLDIQVRTISADAERELGLPTLEVLASVFDAMAEAALGDGFTTEEEEPAKLRRAAGIETFIPSEPEVTSPLEVDTSRLLHRLQSHQEARRRQEERRAKRQR